GRLLEGRCELFQRRLERIGTDHLDLGSARRDVRGEHHGKSDRCCGQLDLCHCVPPDRRGAARTIAHTTSRGSLRSSNNRKSRTRQRQHSSPLINLPSHTNIASFRLNRARRSRGAGGRISCSAKFIELWWLLRLSRPRRAFWLPPPMRALAEV